ncbi:MAG: hypothetical protein JNG86_16640, partial [Verrucomicrobiaceae bacterium]|nr:hypothetical protein [Verrucomicrobiaceae bacterium]
DTRVDLTRDLGLVSAAGSGFPSGGNTASNMLGTTAPSTSTATNTLAASTITFASWSAQNDLTSATADEDGDNASNLLEYALGTDPRSGLQVTRFALEATQSIDAILTRPVEGREDLRFILEAATDLAKADWKPLALPAAAVFNTDGTVTRRYTDLAPAGATLGFLRLRVDLDANRDGVTEATTTSSTHAWTHQTFSSGTRTFSMPLLRPAAYTGTATVNDDGTLTLPVALHLTTTHEIEILDGPHTGLTATVAPTATSSLHHTITPSLRPTTARITLRPHHTLDSLLPAAELADDDRLLVFDSVKNTFVTADAAAPLAAHNGVLVKITGSGLTRAYAGEVRAKGIAIPLVSGTQLISTGSLSSMIPVNDLRAGSSAESADRLRLWNADFSITTTPYSSYYLKSGLWTPQTTTTLPEPLARPFHALFLIRAQPLIWRPTEN